MVSEQVVSQAFTLRLIFPFFNNWPLPIFVYNGRIERCWKLPFWTENLERKNLGRFIISQVLEFTWQIIDIRISPIIGLFQNFVFSSERSRSLRGWPTCFTFSGFLFSCFPREVKLSFTKSIWLATTWLS